MHAIGSGDMSARKVVICFERANLGLLDWAVAVVGSWPV